MTRLRAHRTAVLVIFLLGLLIAASVAIIFMIADLKQSQDQKIESTINQMMKDIMPHDGYTPVKGIDYFDGEKGEKGDNAISTYETETIIKEVPLPGMVGETGEKGDKGDNGATPLLRCNAERNRWEVRYGVDEKWRLLNNEVVACTVKVDDVIKTLIERGLYSVN